MNSATLAALKKKYLKEVLQEIGFTHPAVSPISLLCPISGTFMRDPIITPDGRAYDKEFIEKSLLRKQEDPLTRNKLTSADLNLFDDLSPHIKAFIDNQKKFLKFKKELLQQARAIVHHTPVADNPSLFLCPISNALIKNAVISADGKIYDKDSLKNKKDAPIVVDFNEFQQFIKLYNSRRSNLTEATHRTEEPILISHQRLARFDYALQTLQTKIGQVDQHYLPEAFAKANELLAVLQKARDEYVFELKKPTVDELGAANIFLEICRDKIKEVKPVLERDLGWGEYLFSLLKIVRFTVMNSFSSNPHGFYKGRSLSLEAVEKAEEDLGIRPNATSVRKDN